MIGSSTEVRNLLLRHHECSAAIWELAGACRVGYLLLASYLRHLVPTGRHHQILPSILEHERSYEGLLLPTSSSNRCNYWNFLVGFHERWRN